MDKATGGVRAAASGLGGLRRQVEQHVGLETRVRPDDHFDTRMWLRMLACCTRIENQMEGFLRSRFHVSLSRFDYLAQLDRWPGGMRMSRLSQLLMVTGGNVTGLTRELVKDGLVSRESDPDDGRASLLKLTAKGHKQFQKMAAAHERRLKELLGGVSPAVKQDLYRCLGDLRNGLKLRRASAPALPANKHE